MQDSHKKITIHSTLAYSYSFMRTIGNKPIVYAIAVKMQNILDVVNILNK